MKKPYAVPGFVVYGNLARITGVFGVSGADDVFIDSTGTDISEDPGGDPGPHGGSIDSCAANQIGVHPRC